MAAEQLGKTVLESNLSVSISVARWSRTSSRRRVVRAASPSSGSTLTGTRESSTSPARSGTTANGKKENYSTEKDGNAIAVSNIKLLEPFLRNLTPYFASGARVELQGCLVGGGNDGEKLIRELARIWHVRVQATTEETSISAIGFTGLVVEAHSFRRADELARHPDRRGGREALIPRGRPAGDLSALR